MIEQEAIHRHIDKAAEVAALARPENRVRIALLIHDIAAAIDDAILREPPPEEAADIFALHELLDRDGSLPVPEDLAEEYTAMRSVILAHNLTWTYEMKVRGEPEAREHILREECVARAIASALPDIRSAMSRGKTIGPAWLSENAPDLFRKACAYIEKECAGETNWDLFAALLPYDFQELFVADETQMPKITREEKEISMEDAVARAFALLCDAMARHLLENGKFADVDAAGNPLPVPILFASRTLFDPEAVYEHIRRSFGDYPDALRDDESLLSATIAIRDTLGSSVVLPDSVLESLLVLNKDDIPKNAVRETASAIAARILLPGRTGKEKYALPLLAPERNFLLDTLRIRRVKSGAPVTVETAPLPLLSSELNHLFHFGKEVRTPAIVRAFIPEIARALETEAQAIGEQEPERTKSLPRERDAREALDWIRDVFSAMGENGGGKFLQVRSELRAIAGLLEQYLSLKDEVGIAGRTIITEDIILHKVRFIGTLREEEIVKRMKKSVAIDTERYDMLLAAAMTNGPNVTLPPGKPSADLCALNVLIREIEEHIASMKSSLKSRETTDRRIVYEERIRFLRADLAAAEEELRSLPPIPDVDGETMDPQTLRRLASNIFTAWNRGIGRGIYGEKDVSVILTSLHLHAQSAFGGKVHDLLEGDPNYELPSYEVLAMDTEHLIAELAAFSSGARRESLTRKIRELRNLLLAHEKSEGADIAEEQEMQQALSDALRDAISVRTELLRAIEETRDAFTTKFRRMIPSEKPC